MSKLAGRFLFPVSSLFQGVVLSHLAYPFTPDPPVERSRGVMDVLGVNKAPFTEEQVNTGREQRTPKVIDQRTTI